MATTTGGMGLGATPLIPSKMRAATQLQHSPARPYAVRAVVGDADMPSLDGLPPGMMLMRSVATSICGSDFWGNVASDNPSWRGVLDYFFFRQGCTGGSGHEVVAEVVSVVEPCTRKPGDLLLAMTTGYLHVVDSVRQAFEKRTNFSTASLPKNGSFSEYFVSYEGISVPLPSTPPRFPLGTMLHYVAAQPLGTILHAVSKLTAAVAQMGSLRDQRVAIVGQGQNGLLMTHVLSRMGCREIIACDRIEGRLAVARHAGASKVLRLTGLETREELLKLAGGPVDAALEMVGHQGTSLNAAAALTKDDGVVVVFGLPASPVDRGHAMEIRFGDWARNVKYIPSHAPPMKCFERAVQMLCDGEFDLSFLFTHFFQFSDFSTAFDVASNYADDVIKTMIVFPVAESYVDGSLELGQEYAKL